MSYKQTRKFNQALAGKFAGLCLKNTRMGFSIKEKYEYAIQAWNNTEQHKDRNIPVGVDVPLYYSYKTAGHINVHLANGQVWSDGRLFASLEAYEAATSPVYLGWGESINGVRVIEHVADPVAPAPSGGTLHLNKGTITTTFNSKGARVGSIHATDDTFDYVIRGRNANRVVINSASGGGNGVEVAITYINGGTIPGRYIK